MLVSGWVIDQHHRRATLCLLPRLQHSIISCCSVAAKSSTIHKHTCIVKQGCTRKCTICYYSATKSACCIATPVVKLFTLWFWTTLVTTGVAAVATPYAVVVALRRPPLMGKEVGQRFHNFWPISLEFSLFPLLSPFPSLFFLPASTYPSFRDPPCKTPRCCNT